MQKKGIRLAVFVLAIVMIAAVGMVGCKQNEGETFKVRFLNGEAVYHTVEGKAEETFTLPENPTNEGYEFDGWAESADGTAVEVPTSFSENKDYYAVYTKLWEITLNANGGTVSTENIKVRNGKNLYEAVKDYLPTNSGDATFGAWFDGETEITASSTATVTANKTVTARYKVGYTINVYMEKVGADGAGSGEYELVTTTGSDYVGKKVTPAPANADKYHYANHPSDVTTKVLSQTKSENVFTFHYDLDEYQVYFNANAPLGATVIGDTESKTVVPDAFFDAPNGFLVQGYRFAGWAESADGEVKYLPGAQISVKYAATFYAVWDKGYTDSHGGLDIIFLSSSQPNVGYLHRAGLEEKQGTYNPETRMFRFVTDAGEELVGRISMDNTAFAYFIDDVNESYWVYNAYDWYPTMDTLTLKTFNDAVITDADGSETHGTYRVDEVSGDYIFVNTDGTERQFTLTYSASSGKSVCLLRGEETGEYYSFSPSSGQFSRSYIVYLDGYGTVLYKANDDVGYGTYRYVDEETIFMRATVGDKILSQNIRLSDRNGTPVYYVATSFSGIFKSEDNDDTLNLDGFGKGTYTRGQTEIRGTYDYDTMTYVITFTGENNQTYLFDVNPYARTYKFADELSGVYWWYRGAVLTVQLVIQSDSVVYMYAQTDDGMVAFAYGEYSLVSEGVYHYETEEWNPAIPTYFATYFLNFDFILEEHDYVGMHFKTFSQCYNDLDGMEITTADGGSMKLDKFSGVTYVNGSLTLTGWYDFVSDDPVSRLDIAINNKEYSFIYVDVEGIRGKYLELTNAYDVYHNFLEFDLGMWLLSDDYVLLIDFDYGVPFAFAKYTKGSTRYNVQALTAIYEGYDEKEGCATWFDYGFSFVTRTVDGNEVFIVNSTANRLNLTLASEYGSVRFDAYGYAWYKPTGASTEIECEYVLYMEDLQLKSVTTGAIYELVLTNFLSEDAEEPSFVNKGDNLIFYLREGVGFGPNHYLLAPGGTGTYYRYIVNGTNYHVTTYELTWVFQNGIYTVNYDGKISRFITETYQVDWAIFYVVVEEKMVADEDKFDYTVVSEDKETVIGRLYNEGFGNFYRDDTDGSVYDIYVYRYDTYVAIYIRYSNGTSNGMFFDFIDEDKTVVWLRGAEGGGGEGFTARYSLCEYGVMFNDTYFTFDGHGVARYVVDGTLVAEGTYVLQEDGNYFFEYEEDGHPKSFLFRIELTTEGYYGFVKLHENYGGEFNNDDWIYLELDIYGNYARYIDRYGYVHEGNYLGLSETAIKFSAITLEKPVCFRLNKTARTFSIITDDVLIEDGQLLVLLAEDETVKIPDGITSIQVAFFRGNDTVKVIDLNDVTEIGASAFENCTALESVVGGENLTVINGATFKNCTNLKEIDLTNVTAIGREAFYRTQLETIDLTNAETVGEAAFLYVTGTKNVILGSHIKTIGNSAFSGYGSEEGVSGLTELRLPELTSVGNNAFAGVQTLTKVDAPNLKSVGHSAFRYCYGLADFTFDSMESIDAQAFQYCGFVEVELPNVTYVGLDAFGSCGKLERIVFGAKAETIGSRQSPEGIYIQAEYHYIDGEDYIIPAFNSETGDRISLVSIEVDALNPYYRSENNCLIDKGTHPESMMHGYEAVVWACGTSEIPTDESVRFIGKCAFAGTAVVRVEIPDNIDTLCVGAFKDCAKLVSLTLGAGLHRVVHGQKPKYDQDGNPMYGLEGNPLYDSFYVIGGGTFDGCKNVKEIYNKTGVNLSDLYPDTIGMRGIRLGSVHVYTATGASKLVDNDGFIFYADGSNVELVGYAGDATTLVLPEGFGQDSVEYALGKMVFSGKAFTSITLPSWMTEIPDSAFYGCRYLTSFTVPDGVTAIKNNAFYGCTSLETVVIPASVQTIGASAFANCAKLKTVTFQGNGLKGIDLDAFRNCVALKTVTLPTTLEAIGNNAFSGSGLTAITLPGSLKEVGQWAFANCFNLVEVTVAEGVTELKGTYIFDNCTALTTVNLPNTLTSFGVAGSISGTFFGCTALVSIVIPDSVTEIGVYVFAGCTSLKNVKLSANLTSIPDSAFVGCTALEEIVIPDGVKEIQQFAFYQCYALKTVVLGSGLEAVKDAVFEECYSLETIYYNGTEEEWEGVDVSYNYNDIIFFVKVYFYSEEENNDGKHWHYDHGKAVVWEE